MWGWAGGPVGAWGAVGVPGLWPWAHGAACTRLWSFCGGTSFDINTFLLSTRPTFQTMPLASRLPHSSSAVLPQPAPWRHPCRCCVPAHGAAGQDGHPAWWHRGDPCAGAPGQPAAPAPWLVVVVGGVLPPGPCPCSGLAGSARVPFGVSPPCPGGCSALSLLPTATSPIPWHSPCPGWETALFGDSLVGSGGECGQAGSSQALAPGWPVGTRAPPECPWSIPGAGAMPMLHPGTIPWELPRRAEAVPHSWQLASGWWD